MQVPVAIPALPINGWGQPAVTVALTGSLVLIRVLPTVVLVPVFGGRFAALPIRLGVAFALAMALAPPLTLDWRVDSWLTVETVPLVAREVLVGATIGVLLALIFYAARMAGQIIDGARGHTIAITLEARTPERDSPTARLLLLLTVVIYLAVDGHHRLLRSLAHSFEVVPVLSGPSLVEASDHLVGGVVAITASLFAVALDVALPVLVAVVLADLALGVASRLAPRLHAFFMGLPVRAMLGLLALLVALAAGIDRLVSEAVGATSWVDWVLEQLSMTR